VKQQNGSALALVVGVASVLFVLTGVVYTYFQMNARAHVFKINRARAGMAAEAGAALALHHLESMQSVPQNGEPIELQLEADSAGWISLPDCGSFQVVIEPLHGLGGACSNGAVEIRSQGLSGDVIRDIELGATPAYPSSFALLTDEGIPSWYFVDGRVVNGPVHSNGVVCFSSYSPDSTDDPYAQIISTTASGGFSYSGIGISPLPHPEGSNVWVRPYSNHRQGRPYWNASAPEIDFSRMHSSFSSIASGSVHSNEARVEAERIIINGQVLMFKESQTSEESVIDLTGVDLVIARNGFSSVMVKTLNRPDHPITVITLGDMEIGGEIDGGATGSGGPLGLVALGDIIIPADPDETGGSDWASPWDIETDRGFLVRACLAAPAGCFKAEVPYLPDEQVRITVTGSLTEKTMGRLSSAGSGYYVGNTWEQGLGALHPPCFPMLGRWNVYSWIMDHPDE